MKVCIRKTNINNYKSNNIKSLNTPILKYTNGKDIKNILPLVF